MADPADISDPLPDPPKARGGTGIFGTLSGTFEKAKQMTKEAGSKVAEKAKVVTENPHVQRGASLVKDGAIKTAEITKKGANKVGEVSKKGWDKANENEKVASAVGSVKEFTGKAVESTKQAGGKITDRTKEVSGKVVDKTKEFGGQVADKAKAVSGKVSQTMAPGIEKAKAAVGVTKKKGGNTDSGRGGRTLVRWSFRVKDLDIGFGVRCRVMQDGGSKEEDILGVEKFDNSDTIEGQWMADEDRTIVFVFDNTSSLIRSKTVAYLVGVEPPIVDPLEAVGVAPEGAEVTLASSSAASSSVDAALTEGVSNLTIAQDINPAADPAADVSPDAEKAEL